MYFSQKLIATPAATREQEQQQKMMAYMMPVMFVLILKSLPAAFILYWFLQNMLMTGHQYLMMRSPLVKAAASAAAPSPGLERPKPAGPPPEAIEKLSQGTQRSKKKRKKH
jgi:membrane protein insertase Oxa1/YidC/SpoIIIJ